MITCVSNRWWRIITGLCSDLHVFELSSSRLTDTVGDSLVMKVEHSAAEEPSVIQTQNRDKNRVKVGFSNDDHVCKVSEWIPGSTQTSRRRFIVGERLRVRSGWCRSNIFVTLRLSNVTQPTSARRPDVVLCLLDITRQQFALIRLVWSWTESCFGDKRSRHFLRFGKFAFAQPRRWFAD